MNSNFRLFFISDAHFGSQSVEKEKEKLEKLQSFIAGNLKRDDYLFILGDLFDFWFEYRYLIPKDCFRVLSILKGLVDDGIRIVYIGGNHDFWDSGFLKSELGIEFYSESMTAELMSKRFYLHHGDGFIRKNKGYRLLKRILRNRVDIWLYKLIHPDFSAFLAKFFSKHSRINSSKIGVKLHDDFRRFAEGKFEEGIDFVIMGHTHIPVIERFGEKYFINAGDWMENFTYCVYDGEKIRLEKWE